MTPQIVKRVHELYEELGREDVQAVQDWEKADGRFGKMKPKPSLNLKPNNDQTVEEWEQEFSINTKQRENRDQKTVITTTKKET